MNSINKKVLKRILDENEVIFYCNTDFAMFLPDPCFHRGRNKN